MNRWFQRWGSWTIILGRLVLFIPFDAISYLSGLTKVRIERYAFLMFLGSLPRCLFYAYIEEWIAAHAARIAENILSLNESLDKFILDKISELFC
ncbi:MAG: VTT domain-containing protein [Candidatus Methanomethylicaceae archaeon]